MKIKLLDKGKFPTKSHKEDIGLDLYLPEKIILTPFETKTIGLKMCVAIPEGFAGMIVPRSSIAKKGLIMQTQIIDPGYQGEIHLIVTNCSNSIQAFDENERLCSLVVYSILNPYLEEVNEFTEISSRGKNGLGSSGKY